MVTMPLAGARHVSQTDLPPVLPACFGSPTSRVAPQLLPRPRPFNVETTLRSAKLSANGKVGVNTVRRATALSTASASFDTVTWYEPASCGRTFVIVSELLVAPIRLTPFNRH